MGIAAAVLDIAIREHWLTEPHSELAAVSEQIAQIWGQQHRALLAAAIHEYIRVEQARDAAFAEDQQGEDTSLWDDIVAEFPSNFDDD